MHAELPVDLLICQSWSDLHNMSTHKCFRILTVRNEVAAR